MMRHWALRYVSLLLLLLSRTSVFAVPPDKLYRDLKAIHPRGRAASEAATGDYRVGDYTTEEYDRLTSHELDYEQETEPKRAKGDSKIGPVNRAAAGGSVGHSSDLEDRYLSSSSDWSSRTCDGCIDKLINWLDGNRGNLANLSPWSKSNITNWARAFMYFSEISDTGGYDTGAEVLTGSKLPSYYDYIAQAKDTDFQDIPGGVSSADGRGGVSAGSLAPSWGPASTTSVGALGGLGNSNIGGGGGGGGEGASGGTTAGGGIGNGRAGSGLNAGNQGGGKVFGGTLTLTVTSGGPTRATSSVQPTITTTSQGGTDIIYRPSGILTKLINPTSITTVPEGGTSPYSVSYTSTDVTLMLTVIPTTSGNNISWVTENISTIVATDTGLGSLPENNKLIPGTSGSSGQSASGTSISTTVITSPGSGGSFVAQTVTVTFYSSTSADGTIFAPTNPNANIITRTTTTGVETSTTHTVASIESQISGTSLIGSIKTQGDLASTGSTRISTPTYSHIVVRSSGTFTKTITQDIPNFNTGIDILSLMSTKANLAGSKSSLLSGQVNLASSSGDLTVTSGTATVTTTIDVTHWTTLSPPSTPVTSTTTSSASALSPVAPSNSSSVSLKPSSSLPKGVSAFKTHTSAATANIQANFGSTRATAIAMSNAAVMSSITGKTTSYSPIPSIVGQEIPSTEVDLVTTDLYTKAVKTRLLTDDFTITDGARTWVQTEDITISVLTTLSSQRTTQTTVPVANLHGGVLLLKGITKAVTEDLTYTGQSTTMIVTNDYTIIDYTKSTSTRLPTRIPSIYALLAKPNTLPHLGVTKVITTELTYSDQKTTQTSTAVLTTVDYATSTARSSGATIPEGQNLTASQTKLITGDTTVTGASTTYTLTDSHTYIAITTSKSHITHSIDATEHRPNVTITNSGGPQIYIISTSSNTTYYATETVISDTAIGGTTVMSASVARLSDMPLSDLVFSTTTDKEIPILTKESTMTLTTDEYTYTTVFRGTTQRPTGPHSDILYSTQKEGITTSTMKYTSESTSYHTKHVPGTSRRLSKISTATSESTTSYRTATTADSTTESISWSSSTFKIGTSFSTVSLTSHNFSFTTVYLARKPITSFKVSTHSTRGNTPPQATAADIYKGASNSLKRPQEDKQVVNFPVLGTLQKEDHRTAEAKDGHRPMSDNDMVKVTEEGGKSDATAENTNYRPTEKNLIHKPSKESQVYKLVESDPEHKPFKGNDGHRPPKEGEDHRREKEGSKQANEGIRTMSAKKSDGHKPVINGDHGNEEGERGHVKEKGITDASTYANTKSPVEAHSGPDRQLKDEVLHHGKDLKPNLPKRGIGKPRTTWLTMTQLTATPGVSPTTTKMVERNPATLRFVKTRTTVLIPAIANTRSSRSRRSYRWGY